MSLGCNSSNSLHLGHVLLCRDQAVVAVLVPVLQSHYLFALLLQNGLECGDEFKIGGWSHIVVSFLSSERNFLAALEVDSWNTCTIAMQQFLTDDSISTSYRNRLATLSKASRGHSENQSMVVQLTREGKFLTLPLKDSPIGEKHSTMCRRFLQRSTK